MSSPDPFAFLRDFMGNPSGMWNHAYDEPLTASDLPSGDLLDADPTPVEVPCCEPVYLTLADDGVTIDLCPNPLPCIVHGTSASPKPLGAAT